MRFLLSFARIGVVAAAAVLSSCGQTGALYLPKDEAPNEVAPDAAPQTESGAKSQP